MQTSDYIEKAKHNENFLSNVELEKFSDWYVTVCFYIALHYVNAFISVSLKSGFCSHEKVKQIIHPDGKIVNLRIDRNVYLDYLELQNLSRKARYMQIGDHEEGCCKRMKPKHAKNALSLMESVRGFINSKIPESK